ncbi:MAG: hypothetical protein HUJ76_09160 [Parasporobacterium sp.]|nr:hypothetical protein [Parasporobacterium sp.]
MPPAEEYIKEGDEFIKAPTDKKNIYAVIHLSASDGSITDFDLITMTEYYDNSSNNNSDNKKDNWDMRILNNDAQIVLLRNNSLDKLLQEADVILNGRSMTDEERIAYHIE